jgi:maltose O-acetyltransferase
MLCFPIWKVTNFIRDLYYWVIRIFWITPIFKGICEEVGKHFSAGTFLPFLEGEGRIFLGTNVKIHGKVDFLFGSITNEVPEIHVGNHCGIGHNVTFDISGRLVIGKHCLIARGVTFQDCGGHQIDPEKRKAKIPPGEKQVRSIKIGDNVWIGTGAYILPGTTIGDNCVISAMTTVGRNIPANHLVYSSPAKIVRIRKISKMI